MYRTRPEASGETDRSPAGRRARVGGGPQRPIVLADMGPPPEEPPRRAWPPRLGVHGGPWGFMSEQKVPELDAEI